MDLLFKLFVVGFAIGICGLACAYGAKQAVEETVKKITAPLVKENERLKKALDATDMKNCRYQVELEQLRQAHFEANAAEVLIKEKNPPSGN